MKKLLILLLISLIAVECRRSSQNYEEDDFSDFDSMLDEEEPTLRARPDPLKDVKADFTEFDKQNDDGKVETEGDDEDFEEEPGDINNLNSNSDHKPKPEGSREKKASAGSKQEKKSSSSFSMNNLDDLDQEEFEHFIGKF